MPTSESPTEPTSPTTAQPVSPPSDEPPSTRRRWRTRLTLLATAGLAAWFFGNLYEAVVFSPNWVVDNPDQLLDLNRFFRRTSPTWYVVPLLASLGLIWALQATNRESGLAAGHRRAGLLAAAAFGLNLYIVTTIIPVLFGPDVALRTADELTAAAWRWNVLNVARMGLVAAAGWQVFTLYRMLDRL